MKILHCFFVTLSLLNLNIAKAQKEITESEIRLRSQIEFEALKNEESIINSTGAYFTLDLNEDKIAYPYSIILIKKSDIKNATEIKLYFKKTVGPPYVMSIPLNSTTIIESGDNSNLAAIWLGPLRSEYKKQENLIEPLYLCESFLSEVFPESEQRDLIEIKKIMQIQILKDLEKLNK